MFSDKMSIDIRINKASRGSNWSPFRPVAINNNFLGRRIPLGGEVMPISVYRSDVKRWIQTGSITIICYRMSKLKRRARPHYTVLRIG